MRETFWGFKNTSSRKISNNSKHHSNDDDGQHGGFTSSIINLLKKKKKQQLVKKNDELKTLEQWILASPSLSRSTFTKQDDHLRKDHNNSSNFASVDYNKPMEKILPILVEKFDNGVDRCQSLKVKKKVSFRFPEVADVFILDYSPDNNNENKKLKL